MVVHHQANLRYNSTSTKGEDLSFDLGIPANAGRLTAAEEITKFQDLRQAHRDLHAQHLRIPAVMEACIKCRAAGHISPTRADKLLRLISKTREQAEDSELSNGSLIELSAANRELVRLWNSGRADEKQPPGRVIRAGFTLVRALREELGDTLSTLKKFAQERDVDVDSLIKAPPLRAPQELRSALEALLNMQREWGVSWEIALDVLQQDQIISKRIGALENEIATKNLALIVAMRKHSGCALSPEDSISEGNEALMRAIRGFDPERGFKFSTYACRAILKSFSRLQMKNSQRSSHEKQMSQYDREEQTAEFEDLSCPREEYDNLARMERDEVLAFVKNPQHGAELTEAEQIVLAHRFDMPINGIKPRGELTLEQVGRKIGVTKERVRQIQNHALDKIGKALANPEEYSIPENVKVGIR